MNIDVHAHYIPDTIFDCIRENGRALEAQLEYRDDVPWINIGNTLFYPVTSQYYDKKTMIESMARRRLDRSVLSISPLYFFYGADAGLTLEVCRLCNDWLADYVRKGDGYFEGMATVPMQDSKLAAAEMERAAADLGMKAVEIAPVINGKMPDDEEFYPFYDFCEKNGIVIYLHPARAEKKPPYDKYHAMNMIGYVEETNWALMRMIFGGVFERFPDLKVLSSHGGGHFPYQFGRYMHGHQVRQEARAVISDGPEKYLKNIYFDTITHWTPALQFLVDTYGADHVLMGTDYPYDMADFDPVSSVDALRVTAEQRTAIKCGNWERLTR